MHIENTAGNAAGNSKWKIAFILCFLALIVDGADVMMLSLSLKSIKDDFGLTGVEAGMLGSVTILGMGLGGIYGGWCSDRFGRVKAMAASVLLFSVLTALLSFTQNVWQFGILRFISGVGLGTVYMVATGLLAEYVPTKFRTTTIATLQTGWTFGYIVASLMAGAIIPEHGWRLMFLLSGSAIILSILLYFFVPESESWKAERDRKALAQKSNSKEKDVSFGFNLIFKDKTILKVLIMWIFASMLLHLGYNGVNHWMPTYIETEMGLNYKSMTYYMIASYSAMVFGKISAGIISDKFGRRFSFMFGCIATAVCLVAIVMFGNPSNILYFLALFGFLYGIPFGVYATFMSESFPTAARGTAMGTAHNMGRIGSATAPILVGAIAASESIGYGFLILGFFYLISIVPVLFVREKMFDPAAKAVVEPQPAK